MSGDHYCKTFSAWQQFLTCLYAQITGKDSLREIEHGLIANHNRLYHLGMTAVAKSTLADAMNRRNPENFRKQDFDLKNSPAWNGAMAEAMRQDPRSLRSNSWTHSVSAIGPRAAELTADHGLGRQYPTPWNERAFSEISPWTRFYEWNALYVFFGVTMRCCTMKHWIESRYAAAFLEQFPPEQYSDRRKELMHDCKPGIRFLFSAEPFQKHLEDAGLVNRTALGDAQVLAIRTRVLVDETMRGLVSEPGKFFPEEFLEWMKKVSAR